MSQEDLAEAVNDIRSDIREMRERGGFSTGKSNREEASTSNLGGGEEVVPCKYSPETERIVREMAIRVGTDAGLFAEQMKRHCQEKTHVPGCVMEELLNMSSRMGDSINRMKDSLAGLTKQAIQDILWDIDHIKLRLNQFWVLLPHEMLPDKKGMCNRRRLLLVNSIRGLRFVLEELLHRRHSLLDLLQGKGKSL